MWALGELNDPVAIEPLSQVLAFARDWAQEEEALAALAKLGVARGDAMERARLKALDPDAFEEWQRASEAYRQALRDPRDAGSAG